MSFTNTISPRLPLVTDTKFGYAMFATVAQSVSQNLKCLLLTAPGERVMNPDFGVGLKKYLFQNYSPETVKNMKINIRQQVQKYMPFISITEANVKFGDNLAENQDSTSQNKMFVSISYIIQSIGISDVLNVSIS